jgi:succinate dehydrogenase hydrophobic anchor subunit
MAERNGQRTHPRTKSRHANGVVTAVVVCFFLIHGLLGSFAPSVAYSQVMRMAVWVGVGLVAVHAVLCVVTSYEQLTDTEFPPSINKKRHLVLKWVTGVLLAGAVAVHVICMRNPGAFAAGPFVPRLALAVLAAVLAWHTCVGVKSLLKDVGLSRSLRTPLRVAVCILAALFAYAAILG